MYKLCVGEGRARECEWSELALAASTGVKRAREAFVVFYFYFFFFFFFFVVVVLT